MPCMPCPSLYAMPCALFLMTIVPGQGRFSVHSSLLPTPTCLLLPPPLSGSGSVCPVPPCPTLVTFLATPCSQQPQRLVAALRALPHTQALCLCCALPGSWLPAGSWPQMGGGGVGGWWAWGRRRMETVGEHLVGILHASSSSSSILLSARFYFC